MQVVCKEFTSDGVTSKIIQGEFDWKNQTDVNCVD